MKSIRKEWVKVKYRLRSARIGIRGDRIGTNGVRRYRVRKEEGGG